MYFHYFVSDPNSIWAQLQQQQPPPITGGKGQPIEQVIGPQLGYSEEQWAQKEENLKQRYMKEMKLKEDEHQKEMNERLEKLRQELAASQEEQRRQKEQEILQLTEKQEQTKNEIETLHAEKDRKTLKINELTHSLDVLKQQIQQHIEDKEKSGNGSEEQQKRIEELQAELDRVREDLHRTLQAEKENKAEELNALHEKLESDKIKLQTQIQVVSKRAALDKFGPGPHRVEMHLVFDPASNVYQEGVGPDRIVVEMAPLDEMPHTVFWFLEQVSNKLYDGGVFHMNLPHIVQGGPLYIDEGAPKEEGKAYYSNFVEAGLGRVLFQEYSEKFPHVQYTLGYAGRPGGPDFYISLKDNTINHGPGGQNKHHPAEADPCFAKVIEGIDTIERMHRGDTGDRMQLVHKVVIQKIFIQQQN